MLKWLIYGLLVGTWILEVGFPAGSCGSTYLLDGHGEVVMMMRMRMMVMLVMITIIIGIIITDGDYHC